MTKGEASDYWNGMDFNSYTRAMGGTTTDNLRNTGISENHLQITRYFNMLYNYYCNRFEYKSKILSQQELRLIEHYLFFRNQAVFVKPRFRKQKQLAFELTTPRIYPFNIVGFNTRNQEPTRVNIINFGNTDGFDTTIGLSLDVIYEAGEFEYITDKYNTMQNQPTPAVVAWEFANKLYEYDLMFNANSTKNRLPLIFNNGVKSDGKTPIIDHVSNITDIIHGAVNRNEMFVEIANERVGESGILHEVTQVNFTMEYLEGQDKLINQYLETIGISPMREQMGTYVNKEVQTQNVMTTDYKTYVALKNRQVCITRINATFGLDITVEAWDNMIEQNMLMHGDKGEKNSEEDTIYDTNARKQGD